MIVSNNFILFYKLKLFTAKEAKHCLMLLFCRFNSVLNKPYSEGTMYNISTWV